MSSIQNTELIIISPSGSILQIMSSIHNTELIIVSPSGGIPQIITQEMEYSIMSVLVSCDANEMIITPTK
jgi:hypothetical protein